MKMADVIAVLQNKLPFLSDHFTDNFSLTAATVAGEVITLTTSTPHGLAVGDGVMVTGVKNKLPVASYTGDLITQLNFTADHGYNFDRYRDQYITITGTTNGTDGDYLLMDVPDANTLIIETADAVFEGEISILVDEGFNGVYPVNAVLDSSTFTVKINPDLFTGPVFGVGGRAKTRVRIAGVADIQRFNDAYTAQENGDCWVAVTPASNRTSRGQNVTTDSVTAYAQPEHGIGTVDINTAIIETLEIYVAIPASQEIAGRQAADIAEEARWSLYKSLCGADIPTPASGEVCALMPVTDSYYSYLTDNTTYTHQYVFERAVYIKNADIAEPHFASAPYRGAEMETQPCDSLTVVTQSEGLGV